MRGAAPLTDEMAPNLLSAKRAMQSISLIKIMLIATALIGASAYLRRSPATAEDLRIGRQSHSHQRSKAHAARRISQNSIIHDVKRRHIPEKMPMLRWTIELTESGAKPALIAALKDGDNIMD